MCKLELMCERCLRLVWWAGNKRGCLDGFLGRKKSHLWFEEELRKVQRRAVQEGNLVSEGTSDFSFQVKVGFCI